MTKPLLAITQGDPTGIGAETIVGAWRQPEMHQLCRAMVVGHPQIVQRAVDLLGLDAKVVVIPANDHNVAAIDSSPRRIPCLPCGSDDMLAAPVATIDPRGGQAAYDALVCAAKLALAKQVDGIVTAPLHKAALWRAGHHYPGHTELLAELCGVDDFAMMLYLALPSGHRLGVVHVTLHMALAEVFRHLAPAAILAKAKLVDRTMHAIIGRPVRIAVCAL
ncbi:MAG TPA: 4-hydroxythreonine-4-phosphate dehydrogenase PdxA, partial [Pirellulales bacterium]